MRGRVVSESIWVNERTVWRHLIGPDVARRIGDIDLGFNEYGYDALGISQAISHCSTMLEPFTGGISIYGCRN